MTMNPCNGTVISSHMSPSTIPSGIAPVGFQVGRELRPSTTLLQAQLLYWVECKILVDPLMDRHRSGLSFYN
jgi:hypothetical protein